MFDPHPDHSPDLEWLLQSGEASQSTIIHYLLRETYDSLMLFFGAWLGDPDRAQRLAVEVYASAIQHARAYQGDASIQEWLARLALESIQGEEAAEKPKRQPLRDVSQWFSEPQIPVTGALHDNPLRILDDLEEALRLPWILSKVYGLNTAQIGRVLRKSVEEVEASLRYARANTVFGTHRLTNAQPEEIDDRTLRSWQKRWQAAAPATPDIDQLTGQVEAALLGRRRKDFRHRVLRDGLILAVGLASVFLLIQLQTWRLPKHPARPAIHTVMVTATPQPTPEVTAAPRQRPVPLTMETDPEAVRWRIIESTQTWKSLWADAEIIFYGPLAYLGPPLVYRNQAWIRQPDHALILGGLSDGEPEYLRLIDEAYTYEADLVHEITYDNSHPSLPRANMNIPFLKQTWEPRLSSAPFPFGFYLYDLLRPTEAWWPLGELRSIGMDRVAGREALMVDDYSHTDNGKVRFWIDSETGIVLRLWVYNHENHNLVDVEIRLNQIMINAPIPPHFYTLESAWFDHPGWSTFWQPQTEDERGAQNQERLRPGWQYLALNPPPAKVDLGAGPLVFQWDIDPEHQNRPGTQADLILDGYWMGTVDLGDPWGMTCERSPNGRYIAVTRDFSDPFATNGGLRWIDLNDTATIQDPLPNGVASSDFAFSPDSQTLAFHGCSATERNCGVYLQDLATGKNVKLIALGSAGDFAWSPDGSQLALVGRTEEQAPYGDWELMIVEVSTGMVTYHTPVDLEQIRPPIDAPVKEWGMAYPPETMNLDGCVYPGKAMGGG
ncbi:MAG TPA: hypothetical protein VHO48_16085 [Anaerolineaceae bacterium]|nr:hypothetical protein [Anaerolineaceae bacterium]